MVHRHDGPDHAASRSDDDAAKAADEEVVAKIEQAEAAADKQENAKDNGNSNGDAKADSDAKSDLDADRTVAPGPRSDEIGDPHSLRHRRDWHHIPHTRVRTSTAIVSVLFIVCVIVYGYTSQRYGIVDAPAPQPTHHRTSVETTPETTYSTPSSSYPSTSVPSGISGESENPSEEPGQGGAVPGTQSGQPTTTGGNGFSDFFNNRNNQQETTAVPSR